MGNLIPKEAKKEITDRYAAEVLWVALFQTTSNCDETGHPLITDCSNECAGTGYLRKVHAFTSAQSGEDAVLSGTTTSWSGLTLTNPARFAVVYVYSGANVNKIRGVYDFGSDIPCVSGTLTITWNASGVIKVSST